MIPKSVKILGKEIDLVDCSFAYQADAASRGVAKIGIFQVTMVVEERSSRTDVGVLLGVGGSEKALSAITKTDKVTEVAIQRATSWVEGELRRVLVETLDIMAFLEAVPTPRARPMRQPGGIILTASEPPDSSSTVFSGAPKIKET